jgi:uncharacterized protein (DUF1778 family)
MYVERQAFLMPEDETRTASIEARFAPETLDAIKQAAEIRGLSVNDFVVAAVEEATARTIQLANVIELSPEDQLAFAEAILNPPEPSPALRRAFQAHRDLIKESK